MFVCKTSRKSDGMVSNADNTAVGVLFICNLLLLIRNVPTVNPHDNNGISHSRKQSSSHRDPSKDSDYFGGNISGKDFMQKLDCGELSESVLSAVSLRDIAMDLSRWNHCQFTLGVTSSRSVNIQPLIRFSSFILTLF